MKLSINKLLPVVLALVIPVLSLYTEDGFLLGGSFPLLFSWLLVSSMIFIIWHLLWKSWELAKGVSNVRMLVTLLIYVFGVLFFYEFFLRDMVGISWSVPAIRIVFATVVILIIQFALKAQGNIAQLNLEKEQLQKENYKTQLMALQAQVDPHFLFNSLNTLRSMIRQQNKNSEEFVMSLSDFFRQTLKHNENTTLPLSDELDVLESYLFLMQSRNEEAVQIHIAVDSSMQDYHLPTLALQIAVENCFKHNSMTTRSPLKISIETGDGPYIKVKNNKQPVISDEKPSEKGLAMLQKRYGLLHEDHGVLIDDNHSYFEVKLKLLDYERFSG